MKAIANVHGNWDDSGFDEYGTLLYSADHSGGYDTDEGRIYKKGRKYSVLFASGCSCWDGDWDGWTDLTLTELRDMAKGWRQETHASVDKDLGGWVKDELK